jgi:hypothetical protein
VRLSIYILVFSTTWLYGQRSAYEWRWAVFHPLAAVKVQHINRQCDRFIAANHVKLDEFSNGGTQDAYRHVFYMAAFARKVRPRKLQKLGEAHEKGNRRMFEKGKMEEQELPDSVSCRMDLENNTVGIALGRAHRKATLEEISQMATELIRSGGAYMILRDATGRYLKCDGQPLDLSVKQWGLSKCMVRTR